MSLGGLTTLADMQVLALASSTDTLSVAITSPTGEHALESREKRLHSAVLLDLVGEVMTAACLKPRELAALAVDVGPGAFTGVRTAIAAAQGLALAWSLPIIPVSSLVAMRMDSAQRAGVAAQGAALCVLDARMGEVYHALVDSLGCWVTEPRVGPASALRIYRDVAVSAVLSNLSENLLEAARSALPTVEQWHAAAPSARGILAAVHA